MKPRSEGSLLNEADRPSSKIHPSADMSANDHTYYVDHGESRGAIYSHVEWCCVRTKLADELVRITILSCRLSRDVAVQIISRGPMV